MQQSAEARRVAAALALRRAVLSLAGPGTPGDADWRVAREASSDAWRIVLTGDCCALPLAARLRARPSATPLGPHAHSALGAAELTEMQRVLAARTVLDALDELGAELGIAPVVLKGGALAGERGKAPLDLGDVDVLVDASEAPLVWNALAARGWRLKDGAPMPRVAPQLDPNHLVAVMPPGEGLSLELHTRAEYGAGSPIGEAPVRLLAGRRALHRLVGREGFRMALRHSVIKHPHRRGHIRDLVLLADALDEAGGAEADVEQGLASDAMGPELLSACAQVRAFHRGAPVVDDEATLAFVTLKYSLLVHRRGVLGSFLPGWSGLSHIPLERPAVRRAALGSQLRYAVGAVPASSPFAALSRGEVATGSPPPRPNALRRGAVRVLRAGYRLGLLATLMVTAGYIRRRIRAMSLA